MIYEYKIHIYEPMVDPGGYQGVFTVRAENYPQARTLAMSEARNLWPDNKGLSVWNVE